MQFVPVLGEDIFIPCLANKAQGGLYAECNVTHGI